ncbi:unnamed protein product [Brugia timori]|uniref:Uncharacterized protein n=1 Tax=Brugia timori TaxID=42155 RepID=A0A0R3QDB2_9BILA|nr:unnamed protein product [Brugia timori]
MLLLLVLLPRKKRKGRSGQVRSGQIVSSKCRLIRWANY